MFLVMNIIICLNWNSSKVNIFMVKVVNKFSDT